MKRIFFVAFITMGCHAIAQNNDNLFLDFGCNNFGFSGTYDKKIIKHVDVGLGASFYDYNYENDKNIRFAAYVDIREYWKRRRSLFFIYEDVGAELSNGREPTNYSIDPVNFYSGLGFGYCYLINKRGMGPYISFGLNGYIEHYHSSDPSLPPESRNYSVYDGTGVLSLGFKF